MLVLDVRVRYVFEVKLCSSFSFNSGKIFDLIDWEWGYGFEGDDGEWDVFVVVLVVCFVLLVLLGILSVIGVVVFGGVVRKGYLILCEM